MLAFSWDTANIEHVQKHGVSPVAAEHVVREARPPYPQTVADDKRLVWGQAKSGRYLQVVFVFPDDEDVDVDSLRAADLIAFSAGEATVVRVIHARELEDEEKRRYRKQRGPR